MPASPTRRIRPLLAGGIVLAIIILLAALVGVARHEHQRRYVAEASTQVDTTEPFAPGSDSAVVEPEAVTPGFGPPIEKTVTEGINFKSGKLMSLPEPIQSGQGDLNETILTILRKAELMGVDAFVTDGGLGLYAAGGTTFAPVPATNWDTIAPDEIVPAITNADVGETPKVVMQMGTNETATYVFQTRDSTQGLLQILGTNTEPVGLKIRYKLAQDTRASPALGAGSDHERLSQRLEAAKMITTISQKDSVLSAIAADSAKAGDLESTRDAINEMNNMYQRDASSAVAAKLLAHRGLRAEAIRIASEINNISTRDQTLAELAR